MKIWLSFLAAPILAALAGAPLLAQPQAGPDAAQGPDAEVKQFRMYELAARVPAMQPGAERDYFAGVLANRRGRVAESIRLLSGALPRLRSSNPDRAGIALRLLADDYVKSFDYAAADHIYDDLLSHFAKFDAEQGVKDDAALARLLKGAPPQTITWHGKMRLRTERNPLGSVNAELTVNGVRGPWLLDTGANISVVSRSFAQRLGLTLLPGSAQTAGSTGIENPLRVALLPALTMGGAELRNVAVIVLDDAHLKVGMGKQTYQIQAIAGYPVLQALGRITFLRSGWVEASDAGRIDAGAAPMYMDLLTPVVECGAGGRDLPFGFDTGASGTSLSPRYYQRFRGQAGSWKKGKNTSFGAGGAVTRPIYLAPRLRLNIGDKVTIMHNVPVFPASMGSFIDQLYGSLGQDAVASFASFTVDFRTMSFSLGRPLPKPSSE